MNELISIINQVSGGEPEEIIYDLQSVIQNSTASMIAGIVIGLLICFFGLKLIRVLAALAGALAGAVIGLAAGIMFGLEGTVMLIAAGALAVILACLSAILYRVGAFVWLLMLGVGAALITFTPDSLLTAFICLGAGLILSIITAIFLDPIIIIISAVAGGFIAGISAAELTGLAGSFLITVLASLVLAVIGLVIQFMMKSREVGKKERLYSESFREKESMETEVERARMLLDDEDGEKKSSPDDEDPVRESEDDEDDDDITFIE